MSGTPRLGFPFLSAGQAQKEILHNEALQLLDIVVAAAVEELPRASAPSTPPQAACYIVGAPATGEWAGKEDMLAGYSAGGWRFIPPVEGTTVFVRSTATWALYREGAWELGTLRGSSLLIDGQKVVGSRASAITAPAGGSNIDVEARATIGEILSALRQHGLIEM